MSIRKILLMSTVLLGASFCSSAQQKPSVKSTMTPAVTKQQSANTAASMKTIPGLYDRYNIYAGAQHTYIGHFFLLPNGKYRVALSSDEEQYGSGQYKLTGDPAAIEWTEGLFRHNRWYGRLVTEKGQLVRIEFSSLVYATKDKH